MTSRKGKKRWIAPWFESEEKPSIYHCVSRVVDRRFAFGDGEREKFRMFMRMMENFSGCRVLTYCVMSNHFHVLLEVPPMPAGGIPDAELLRRLGVFYGENFVKSVADELEAARAEGGIEGGNPERVAEIHGRFTKRMHDLSEFMKTVLQRFTRWFNRTHSRSGTLWEERFKSVIVESGTAARTMAAYIDLNPVRAGMVEDPADYRWSGYGEAVGGGAKGNGKKAREGLVRAITSDTDTGFDAGKWKEASRRYRRYLGMALERKTSNFKSQNSRKSGRETQDLEAQDARKEVGTRGKNDAEYLEAATGDCGHGVLPELSMAKMLRCRVRYFTEGAVIGSRGFVNEVFEGSRERFTERRKDGARRMRGSGAAAKGVLWSMRDLRVRV
jgi:REP element-mobilizing transposase RayT